MFGNELAREVARAEAGALCDALLEAIAVTIYSPDLPADEVGQGIADVVKLWSSEVERRIPTWIGTGPDTLTAPTDEENPVRNPLSDKDQAAVELAKMTRRDPSLRERVRKVDEARASKEPVSKMHPVSKMSEESEVLAEYENDVLQVMSKERCSHEVAIGKIARDPAFYSLRQRYRDEQRALRGA